MKKQVSSGAEKAEELTRKKTNSAQQKKSQPAKAKTNSNKSKTAKSAAKNKAVKSVKEQKKLQKKEQREQKKLEAAKIKAEKKQKRLEKKLEHKQKRLDRIAAFKEKRAEQREKRRERRDMLKHETKEARIQRRAEEREAKIEARVAKREAAVAERQAKREHRLKVRAEKRANRQERQRASYGGWLAAVITLGVTTLALGTMTTLGWLNSNGMQADMADVHTQSLYELNSIVDNLETNLAKARVSNSSSEQVRLLSDIAIESEMAEVILERLPVETQLTQNMTSFVNKMGDSAQSMLYSVARGNELTESQKASIQYMYDVNSQMKEIINELASTSTTKEMIKAIKGSDKSLMVKSFGDLENNTIETPKEIQDGPFSDSVKKVSAKNLENLEEINATNAEELAQKYFNSYEVSDVRCTGETIAQKITCYNVTMQTKDGEMFAQISKQGGKVVMFDSYKDCSDNNFSVERCIDIAKDFLNDLGFDNMTAVWTSENGTTCNLNFAYEQEGVIFYPDIIKVKVCEQRGIVTGMEGLSYVLNHTERTVDNAEISESEAEAKLNPSFNVEGSRLTVIPLEDREVLAYEFYGTYGENDYYIYVDAMTGEEVQVFTVVGTKQGRALM